MKMKEAIVCEFTSEAEMADLNYPREFLSGKTDKVRFVYTGEAPYKVQLFVEAVERKIEKNVTLITGYSMAGIREETFPKVECIITEAYSKEGTGQWKPFQPDVLYIVDGRVIKSY